MSEIASFSPIPAGYSVECKFYYYRKSSAVVDPEFCLIFAISTAELAAVIGFTESEWRALHDDCDDKNQPAVHSEQCVLLRPQLSHVRIISEQQCHNVTLTTCKPDTGMFPSFAVIPRVDFAGIARHTISQYRSLDLLAGLKRFDTFPDYGVWMRNILSGELLINEAAGNCSELEISEDEEEFARKLAGAEDAHTDSDSESIGFDSCKIKSSGAKFSEIVVRNIVRAAIVNKHEPMKLRNGKKVWLRDYLPRTCGEKVRHFYR